MAQTGSTPPGARTRPKDTHHSKLNTGGGNGQWGGNLQEGRSERKTRDNIDVNGIHNAERKTRVTVPSAGGNIVVIRTPKPTPTTSVTTNTTTATTTIITNTTTSTTTTGQSSGDAESLCQPVSGQHGDYIKNNLDILKKKCEDFQKCTDALYSAENFHRVLAGEDLELSNICGLLHKNDRGRYVTLRDECKESERDAILRDIDSSLTKTLVSPPQDSTTDSWNKLRKCLEKNSSPGQKETRVDKVCRLKENSNHTLGFLCDTLEVDTVTEKFFNHELEHLHCSCAALTAKTATGSGMPLRAKIGSGVGLGLIVILIVAVIALCRRQRRLKRRLTQEKLRMHYLPSPMDDTPVYQEIGGSMCSPGYYPPGLHRDRPPTLPSRYVKNMSHSQTNLADPAANEYLEPLADLPDISHMKPGDPRLLPRHDLYDLARNPGPVEPAPREGPYDSVDIVRRDSGEEDGGYSTLGRRPSGKIGGGEGGSKDSEETSPLTNGAPPGEADGGPDSPADAEPKYFVLEPEEESEPLTGVTVTQL